jgi:hypothetical protein
MQQHQHLRHQTGVAEPLLAVQLDPAAAAAVRLTTCLPPQEKNQHQIQLLPGNLLLHRAVSPLHLLLLLLLLHLCLQQQTLLLQSPDLLVLL